MTTAPNVPSRIMRSPSCRGFEVTPRSWCTVTMDSGGERRAERGAGEAKECDRLTRAGDERCDAPRARAHFRERAFGAGKVPHEEPFDQGAPEVPAGVSYETRAPRVDPLCGPIHELPLTRDLGPRGASGAAARAVCHHRWNLALLPSRVRLRNFAMHSTEVVMPTLI